MKRIGIDARLINQTGVGVYIRNLLHYLQTSSGTVEYYVYAYPQDLDTIPNKAHLIKRPAPFRWHSVAEQTHFLRTLYEDKLDLMHFTYFSFPYLYLRPFVITIHDLTPLLFKTGQATTLPTPLFHVKHTVYQHVLARGIKKSTQVIVPSEAVRSAIIHYFGHQYKNKIVVTHEGIDFELQKMKPDESIFTSTNSFLKNSRYFIYIGNSYPHKNVEKMLKAFAQTKTTMKLIVVGPKDFFSASITQLINNLGISERVLQLFNISQQEKIALFKKAHALVQPSLTEGFGLPVVEAQYFGCPILASKISVFDEILHERTLRFDPYSQESIRKALEQAAHQKLTTPKLDTKRFSFENMTQKTQQIYTENV